MCVKGGDVGDVSGPRTPRNSNLTVEVKGTRSVRRLWEVLTVVRGGQNIFEGFEGTIHAI